MSLDDALDDGEAEAGALPQALGGYKLVDGRSPVAPGDRLRYSLLGGVVGGVSGYLNFLAVARAWRNARLPVEQQDFFYQLAHPGVLGELGKSYRSGNSLGSGWIEAVLVGIVAGGAVTYYGFRYLDERPTRAVPRDG